MLVLNAADTIAGVASAATEVTCTIMGMTLAAGVETYDILDQRQLPSSVATIYTVPGSTQAFIKSIHVVNNGASARTFQLFANGTAAENAITPAISLGVGGFAVYGEHGWRMFDSAGEITSVGNVLLNVQNILQGTTTYTPTTGTRAIYIEMVGGGGGGGGVLDAATNSAGGGGGGGSAYAAKFLLLTKASYACVVGALGTGGAAGANNGNPGTDSTFDSPSVCTADGGAGGISDTVSTVPKLGGEGGAGGLIANSVGDIRHDGEAGSFGIDLAAAIARSGDGGDSHFGKGAQGRKTQGDGAAAGLYGAGGAGGCNLSSAASQAGGNGSNGLIRIMEFA